jgi:uncharacterized protein (TIGR03089 family)
MAAPAARTVPDVLADQLRRDAGRPFVTFYDDATGERVELSVATYANWVAKTAGLVQDELDVARGDLVLVDLPTHWLGAVWLAAAWSVGLVVTDEAGLAGEADLVVCGPDRVPAYADQAGRVPVLALSLQPLGGRFTEALPTGVTDYNAVVLAQPDAFAADNRPDPGDVGWRDTTRTATQGELVEAALATGIVAPGGRLLTDLDPVSWPGLATLLAPLAAGAGVVWVRHPDAAAWDDRRVQERASDVLRS